MSQLRRDLGQSYHQQLKQHLRQQIATGQIKADMALPDEASLARELGISVITVRRGLSALAREGVLKRVRGKGTFVRASFAPQRPARRLCVGIVAQLKRSLPGGLFYYRLLHALQAASEECGVYLTFRDIVEPYETYIESLRNDKGLKALIVMGVSDAALLRLLEGAGKPLVLLDSLQPPGGPRFDEVNHCGEEGVFKAVLSLIELQHRDIALVQNPTPNALFAQRQAGYQRALKVSGLTLPGARIYQAGISPEAGYACMQRLLLEGPLPTALVCASDDIATGIMGAAWEHGLKLPRDLSVVGFGDIGHFTAPPLSTVRVPVEQMGSAAMQALRDRLQHPTAPLKQILLNAEWISRGSCAAPRAP